MMEIKGVEQWENRRDDEITVDRVNIIFIDILCFKEMKFKHRIEFANNFRII